ncbi:MAG: hypothetical protein ACXW1S_10520 [Acidimicrobiia bacterium]
MAETATILVTDLVDSTATRVSLGEDRAEQLRRDHDEAEMELRLGVDGDASRARMLLVGARAGCTHPALAPWIARIDALEARLAGGSV